MLTLALFLLRGAAPALALRDSVAFLHHWYVQANLDATLSLSNLIWG